MGNYSESSNQTQPVYNIYNNCEEGDINQPGGKWKVDHRGRHL